MRALDKMRENDYNRPTDFSQIKAQVSGMEAVKIKAVLNQNVFGNPLLGILTESFEIKKYLIDLDFTLGTHMAQSKFSHKLFHKNNCIVCWDRKHSILAVNDLLCHLNAILHYITPMAHSTPKVLLQWH